MAKVIFSCPYCNHIFKLKHHLKAHLQRKKSCLLIKKNTKNTSFTKKKHNLTQFNTINDSYNCDFCYRKFKRKWVLKRHLTTCKKRKGKIEQEELEKELEEARNKIKELEDFKNKQLYSNKINTQNNTTNNNTTNNNNCNNTVNIMFNDYGDEDALKNIKYKNLIKQILGNGMNGLQKYIKYKYCNPELQENLTIKYTNDRSDKLKIRKNNKWKTRDKNEVMNELYDRDNNIEEVLNVYEHINDLDDGGRMDEIQEHFVDEINKFYNEDEDEEDRDIREEMKRIKKITLNDFYDCYKQNKTKF